MTEERRRLLMEIIFHKCEFVGEMAVVQQAQRNLCLESYDRIEQTLKHCIEAKMLPGGFNDASRSNYYARLYFRPDGKLALCPAIF